MSKVNGAAFECVVQAWQAHEKELLAFLIHRVGSRDAAEDLMQEVFLKSMRQGQAFCELENPRAWLFHVARNALIDSTRLARPLEGLPDQLADAPKEERLPVDQLDTCIERNLPDMEPEDRNIIDACDLQGQTVRAYAQAHGITVAAAKSRLLRARKRLRDRLVQNCQVRFDEAGQVCCHVPRLSV